MRGTLRQSECVESRPALRGTSPRVARCTESDSPIGAYFGSCFGISPFSFSMSLMFILMPPGMMMSPGF